MKVLATNKEWQTKALQLNREQLYSGVDSENRSLGVYSLKTILIKEKKQQPTDRVTLLDTGDFYASLYLVQKEKSLEIDSKDVDQTKVNRLLDVYGENIFGVTEQNKVILRELATPILAQYLKNQLNQYFRK